MKIAPWSSAPDNIEFLVLTGPMKGRIVWEFENDFAMAIHIKEIILERKKNESQ